MERYITKASDITYKSELIPHHFFVRKMALGIRVVRQRIS